MLPPQGGRKEGFFMDKYCVKCGHKFDATGREVICPECRESAKLEAKRAAVMRAKRASWTGESVPVRISGRASTVIRRYGAAHNVPFAQALDALLQSTGFFAELGVEWQDIVPYKSRRLKKSAQDVQDAASKPQGKPQDVQDVQAGKPQGKPQEVTKAAKKTASKAVKTAKTAKK